MPEPGRIFSDGELRIEGLNPAFLRSRGIMPLNRTGTVLTIACTGELTDKDRSALKFATGAEIELAELPGHEIAAYLAALPGPAERLEHIAAADISSSAQAPTAPDRTGQTSLMDLLGARLYRPSRPSAPFAPLAQLLEAGYSPREAGVALIQAPTIPALDPALATLARRLAAGTTLGEAVEQDRQIPRWLRLALASSHSEASQITAFVRLVEFDRMVTTRSATTPRQRFDCAMLWVAAAAVWFMAAIWAGIFVAALGLAGTLWLRALSGSDHRSDAMRARVLGMLEVAASLGLPPSAAIRISMASLDAISPTWGTLPDTREGLADALALPPISRALLIKNALVDAARLTADVHLQLSDVYLARCHWLNSRLATGLFMAALIVLVGR